MCELYMFLGEHIGADPVLPFLDPELTGQKLLNGANFASAGIGILNDTGIQFVSGLLLVKKWIQVFNNHEI